jgi:hypothetical protein
MANREQIVVWDFDDEKGFNDAGEQFANNLRPYIYAKENISVDLQIVKNYVDENTFEEYTGFAGESISCTATIDNDFFHVDKGSIVDASLTGAITSVEISGLDNAPTQTGFIQLKNAANEKESVDYTAVTVNGSNLVFTVDKTLDFSYVAGDQGNVSDPPLIKTLNVNIDQTNKDTGRFIITLDADSAVLVDQIEGKPKLTDTKFEFKVKGADTKLAFVALFDFNVKNTQDDDGTIPPPADSSDFYDRTETDALLEDKMDKQPVATNGNIAEFQSGQAIDSGFSFADFGVDVTNQSTAILSMTGTTTASGTVGNVILPAITGEIIDVELNVKYPITYAGGEVTITAPENIVTLFSIDKDNNIIQSNPPVDCLEARDRIFFSAASTIDGVNVDDVVDNAATTPYSPALSLSDLWDVIGAVSNSKNVLTANGANLSVNTSELDLWFTAINFKDKKCPNKIILSSISAPTLTQYYSDGSGGLNSLQSASIDPTKWDDKSGVLGDVGLNTFTNVNFYKNPQTGDTSCFFGQILYSSQAGALAGINQDLDSINTDLTFRTQYYIGTITVRQDSTLLNDASQAVFSEGQKVAKFFDNIAKMGDGLIQNRHSVSFTSNGVTSSIILTATEEEDIELQLDGQPYSLPSPASINLIHGTDADPKTNYVYITEVGGVPQMNVSESDPMVSSVGLFANVWQGTMASAVYSGTAKGPKTYQKKTDYFGSAENQSHIRIANDHFRRSALVRSGVVPTSTPVVGGGTSTTVYFDTSAGLVDQLTPHTRNVYSSLADGFEVPNDEITAFTEYNGLHELTTDSNGDSLTSNNRIAVFFAFGTQDEEGTYGKTFINKPNGYYSDQTAALADAANTAIYDYPAGFEGTAFPIALYITKFTSGGNYEVLAVTDKTGGLGGEGGGSSAGVTNFLGMTDTPTDYTGSENYSVKVNAGGTGLVFVATGAGESNTISSVGTSGAELTDGKDGIDLQVRKLNSLSSAITIVADVVNKKVDINLIQSNITVSASQVSNFASVLAGTTNTTPFTPTQDYHVATKKYVLDNAASPVWGAIETKLTNYTLDAGIDLNKWFQLDTDATAQRTFTTDPTAIDKFNFWVSSENATYDVVVAGGSSSVLDQSTDGSSLTMVLAGDPSYGACANFASSFNELTFSLAYDSVPLTGNMLFEVFAITGTVGTDALPTGSAVASGVFDSSNLTASLTDYSVLLDSELPLGDYSIVANLNNANGSVKVGFGILNVAGINSVKFSDGTGLWTQQSTSIEMYFLTSLTETINGQPSVTISPDDKAPKQFIKDGSNYIMLSYEESAGGGATFKTMIVQDQKSSGTGGGSNVTGRQQRTLNTVVINEISGASLASNEITLPPGDYLISARAPSYRTNANKCFITRVSGDSLTEITGSSEIGISGSDTTGSNSIITERRLTAISGIVIDLNFWCQTVRSGNGLGYASISGDVEVYAEVIIQKIG